MSWGPLDLLRPLFDFLICLVKFAVGLLVSLLIGVVNLLVAGLMALVGGMLALLPNPEFPSFTAPSWLESANWLFPVDHFLAAVVVVTTVLVVWQLVQIALRWAKVIE